ncbi:Alpha-crystallin domain-containing protein 22.3 [Quillaja saponaria]|uniref:Alpha-crystallin domain-containing protein 22.3 n=1 Tax=Quillaja saponaria TaxID=32244 RepID=A0AAD7PTY3_QUISA|nr:Alpha-crystallin domain-containing protein 22.3 [Quillaja saponaria]
MDGQGFADHIQLKPSAILTGTAKHRSVGAPIGLVDIGTSEKAYLFRVALPGVQDECKVKCEILRDGRVKIEGEIAGVGFLRDASIACQMRSQQLCPPEPFTISFSLPGPVDPRLFFPAFRLDGVLEVMVLKPKVRPVDGSFPHP